MKDNNPISPHIQVYNWHISSLVSISHRITGVINYLLLILVCFWVISLIFGSESYQYFKKFSESMVGKFFIIGFIWSYLFQILCEIRHWFWDMGYGFELRTTKITGVIVIIGSFILTIALYLISGVLI